MSLKGPKTTSQQSQKSPATKDSLVRAPTTVSADRPGQNSISMDTATTEAPPAARDYLAPKTMLECLQEAGLAVGPKADGNFDVFNDMDFGGTFVRWIGNQDEAVARLQEALMIIEAHGFECGGVNDPNPSSGHPFHHIYGE